MPDNIYSNLPTGIFGWIADITSNVILPSASTAATNIMQCLERGPRIISSPLDLETKTVNTPAVKPTEPPTERVISGRYSNNILNLGELAVNIHEF